MIAAAKQQQRNQEAEQVSTRVVAARQRQQRNSSSKTNDIVQFETAKAAPHNRGATSISALQEVSAEGDDNNDEEVARKQQRAAAKQRTAAAKDQTTVYYVEICRRKYPKKQEITNSGSIEEHVNRKYPPCYVFEAKKEEHKTLLFPTSKGL